MMPSQSVIVRLTVGSQIYGTCVLASLIIFQMLRRESFVLSMWTLTYRVDQSQKSCQILQMRFESMQSLTARKELPTSYLTAELPLPSLDGSGVNTQGLTNTLSMRISALRKRLTMTVLFFRYLC